MRKKMYWGMTSLILIIGVVGVYFMLQPDTDPEPEKKFIMPSETDLEKAREAKQPPREAKDGFTWEWHDDHWHEVPIVQNETPSGHPVQENQSEKPEFAGPLTFHEELLESNPLKALRLQSEERGHWSAKWIAEFDANDEEAQAFARTVYLRMYYNTLYKTTGKIPISEEEYNRLGEEYSAHFRSFRETIPNPYRRLALLRISWAFLPQKYEPIIN
ncbi:hypothetical protein JT359_08560 [Candidatus Poribacteria bacterium]|nr:hypothetical protein [Candidatus Poribacteria bacterium]